ncbi:MAG: CoA transferase [Gammaproteobacteria bacterium]|nr:CoA transferase [Gammaproteobacteria bacterium]
MAGPLSPYRIVDLTSMVSGPYATQLLCDQGADVIKVETLGGDLMRHAGPARGGMSAAFLTNNRGKRSIALDLKQERGMAILEGLIETADVFVQNFRPGAAERMGLGEDRVRALKSDIVYVSISGFGESGPYVHKRVYDPVIQALAGVMDMQGGLESPRFMKTILPDKLTAVTAAQAITAALLGRERTGQGDHVRLAMLDVTVVWMWPDGFLNHTLIGEGVSDPLPMEVYDQAFETTDGHMVAFVASDDEWRGFARAAGRPELITDERYKDVSSRVAHIGEAFDEIRAVLRTGTTAEWLAKLDAEQVPTAPVNKVTDVFEDPQVVQNGTIRRIEHPHGGAAWEARPAARFDEHALDPGAPAPMLGEHTEEVLAELGIEDVAVMREAGVVG